MSTPRTAAGRALLAEHDFHDPACPRWSDVGNPDAPCSCSLPKAVAAIEAEAIEEGMLRQLERHLHEEAEAVPDVVLGMQALSTREERP